MISRKMKSVIFDPAFEETPSVLAWNIIMSSLQSVEKTKVGGNVQ